MPFIHLAITLFVPTSVVPTEEMIAAAAAQAANEDLINSKDLLNIFFRDEKH